MTVIRNKGDDTAFDYDDDEESGGSNSTYFSGSIWSGLVIFVAIGD